MQIQAHGEMYLFPTFNMEGNILSPFFPVNYIPLRAFHVTAWRPSYLLYSSIVFHFVDAPILFNDLSIGGGELPVTVSRLLSRCLVDCYLL